MTKRTKKRTSLDNTSYKLGILTQAIEDLKIHFANHLHNHRIDRIINVLLFVATIAMFCILKWG